MSSLSNFFEFLGVYFFEEFWWVSSHCRESSAFDVGEHRVDAPGRVENLASEIVESDLTLQSGYEWVDINVIQYFFKYRWSSMIELDVVSLPIRARDAKEDIMALERCITINNVCHDCEDN